MEHEYEYYEHDEYEYESWLTFWYVDYLVFASGSTMRFRSCRDSAMTSQEGEDIWVCVCVCMFTSLGRPLFIISDSKIVTPIVSVLPVWPGPLPTVVWSAAWGGGHRTLK